MQSIHVKPGARIFAAGDPSDAVFIIESGTVVISIGDPLALTEVARLGPGELFGEAGVLEGRCHAATASALTDTTLLIMTADAFLTAFGMKNDNALTLVKLICKRLRQTTHRPHHPAATEPSADAVAAPICLRPDHESLGPMFGMRPIMVEHLPFQVGNRQAGDRLAISSNHSLTIQAHGDGELGAPHFEILRRDGRIGVRDLGTDTGTIVNGAELGRGLLDTFAALHPGENRVVAGSTASPFRFTLTVPG